MRITIVIVSSIMLLSIVYISGCVDVDEPYHEVDKSNVRVNDIWIWFVVEWKEMIDESYVLIPTLEYANGTMVPPMHEWIGEDRFGYPVNMSDHNFTIVDTVHGKALRYDFTSDSVWESGGLYRSSLRIPYILGNAGIVFSTWDDMDVKDRFFEGGPGFSIWEKSGGKVKTWTYVHDESNWIRLYLERGGNMHDDHTWGNFDCYKSITHENDGKGWFNIELERRTSFPMD